MPAVFELPAAAVTESEAFEEEPKVAARVARWLASAPRRGVLVSGLVAGVGALVVVGIVLQGNQAMEDAEEAVRPTAANPPAFVTQPSAQPEQVVEEVDPSLDSGAPREATATPAADADAEPRPVPSAPLLLGQLLPNTIDIAPTYSDQPMGALPAPVRPTVSPTSTAPAPPTLTAITQAPQVRNAETVRQALDREYPMGLRQAGVGGRVEMTFSIDAQGAVQQFRIQRGSGHALLDQAALRVAQAFQFTPALRGTERVATEVSIGITFGEVSATGDAARPAASRGANPIPAQFDLPPQVTNTTRVQQAILREYPAGLRDAQVGGRIDMWFYVNAQGVVERFQIKESSGNRALDEAALRVAPTFQFSPARRSNQSIATWFSLGIAFGGAEGGNPAR